MPKDPQYRVDRDGTVSRLVEGLCFHCGYFVQFKNQAEMARRQLAGDWEGDGRSGWAKWEEFLLAYCSRPSCDATVVRRVYDQQWEGSETYVVRECIEVLYPTRKSSRRALATAIPEAIRKKYDEAAAIEFLSPTCAGFMAGRLVEQAIRHRLVNAGLSKRKVRKTALEALIDEFLKRVEGSAELREMLLVVRGFRNVAAHAPQPEDAELVDITQDEATYLLDAAEELLDFAYTRPAKIAAMQERLKNKEAPKPAAPAVVIEDVPIPPKPFSPDDDVPF